MTQTIVRAIFAPGKLIALSIMLLTALTPYASADTLLTITTNQLLQALNTTANSTALSQACPQGTPASNYCAIYWFKLTPVVSSDTIAAASVSTPQTPNWTYKIDNTGANATVNAIEWGPTFMFSATDTTGVLKLITANSNMLNDAGFVGIRPGFGSEAYTVSQMPLTDQFRVTFTTSAPISSYNITANLVALNADGSQALNAGGTKTSQLSFTYSTATPEPESALLLLGGLAAVLGLRGRQRRARLAAQAR
jgi:hypothetical protein